MEFPKPKTSHNFFALFLTMQFFGDVFEKNIDLDVFDDVLQNAKHRENDASNYVIL